MIAWRRLPTSYIQFVDVDHTGQIDSTGREICSHQLPENADAARIANGRIICLTRKGTIFEVSCATGQELKRVQVAGKKEDWFGSRIEGLVNGNYMVLQEHAVLKEIDGAGKTLWQRPFNNRFPEQFAARLRNGNFLLINRLDEERLVEIDRAGKVIWEAFFDPDAILPFPRVCLGLVRFGFDAVRQSDVDLDSPQYRAKGLKDKDVLIRRRSAFALNKRGSAAAPVIRELIDAMADTDELVRNYSAEALSHTGSAARAGIIKARKDRNPHVRALAASLLMGCHDKAQEVIPY